MAGKKAKGQAARSRAETPKPVWHADRRCLMWAGRVVIQFDRPAPYQELIIEAFAKADWPSRIDDPLPNDGTVNARQRLHDAVSALNAHQSKQVLKFSTDGFGDGVVWRLINGSS